ncbi:cytochrome d ubiquinol oxidase subunit II [Chloroflexota bacterium]
MDLNTVWFFLVAVLLTGFFLLEGFDYGVGILMPFLGKDDTDRRVIINTIGPVWDGNEVWLVTAGGAIFAAFPEWYATMFSGFYLALVVMLLALIVRGVSFEFRSKDKHPRWRKLWDSMLFLGSLVPAILWGVAFGNLLRGVPINAEGQYVGTFWDLLNPYALLGGLATLSASVMHGNVFLCLKTKGKVRQRAEDVALRLWVPALILVLAFVFATVFATDMFARLGVNPGPIPLGAGVALILAGWFIHQRRFGWAFVMTSLTIALSTATVAIGLYPRVMVSSLNPAWSLTIYNASSSPYTLRVMTIVALIFVPIVLIYQGWSYYIFRKRIGRKDHLEY